MFKRTLSSLSAALVAFGASSVYSAQLPEEVMEELIAKNPDSTYLVQSPQNLMMMPDNPAWDSVEAGEKLFRQPRGPKNASLEKCDFGKGPGVLEGAYVELPRYFADAGKVMDIQARLEYCMKTLQGFTDQDPAIKVKHGHTADTTVLQAYIASKSNGMPWNPPLNHPMEKLMRDTGEVMFYRRSGNMDFNCAACHSQTGQRIRASVLPGVSDPADWSKAISWPAYRFSHEATRSSSHRLYDCYWQMRYPNVTAGSDASIAVISFWTDAARGQPAILPDLKR
ncbi:MAG TPA: sulfur oxidation c-type cytochrome SoxA [Thiobacillaceae bacterium]|nr:sulfur oxidation c-type cytochrome SoxA [Thiobacillaceae bacterium]HNU63068.1 sulfur oxidation c-type cytochrome SoxA [Thiobacillaceae bacterium]